MTHENRKIYWLVYPCSTPLSAPLPPSVLPRPCEWITTVWTKYMSGNVMVHCKLSLWPHHRGNSPVLEGSPSWVLHLLVCTAAKSLRDLFASTQTVKWSMHTENVAKTCTVDLIFFVFFKSFFSSFPRKISSSLQTVPTCYWRSLVYER